MECDDEGLFLRLCRGVNIQGNPKWTSNGRILWTGQDYYYYKNNVIGVSKNLKQWEFYEFDGVLCFNRLIFAS
ncbi:hypothetical protein ABEV00_03980 [Paenibacillus thiaminolyticus]|uniref:hypothetical protein n=1 Tax=Paenibacillus TaxID=44249 RepID=UPI00105A4BFB|nr:hypothetical protein [Paenibacillus dendritiformis]TDL55879.1 hypothetical protein E2R60_10135 [Paenibacillus dendritiformis]